MKSRLDNRKDERDWARRRNGVTQPNSGRMWHRKADVRDAELLTDTKQTERGSFTITVANWRKLEREAIRERRVPCIKISFLDSGRDLELIVLPAHYLDTVSDVD